MLEHELYHIGVMRDEDGEIVYSDSSGLPKHYLAGHDVEEFIGVVKRYGPSKMLSDLLKSQRIRRLFRILIFQNAAETV